MLDRTRVCDREIAAAISGTVVEIITSEAAHCYQGALVGDSHLR